MPKHMRPRPIQGGATRPRAEGAGSRWIPAGRGGFRQAGVAEGLWGTTLRRRPLLTAIGKGAKIRSRHGRKMNLNRP